MIGEGAVRTLSQHWKDERLLDQRWQSGFRSFGTHEEARADAEEDGADDRHLGLEVRAAEDLAEGSSRTSQRGRTAGIGALQRRTSSRVASAFGISFVRIALQMAEQMQTQTHAKAPNCRQGGMDVSCNARGPACLLERDGRGW